MLPLLPTDSRFSRPDWKQLHERIDAERPTPERRHSFWTEQGREWVHALRAAFGADKFTGYESPNFWLVSSQPEATNRRLIGWAEETRKMVLRAVEIDAAEHLFGKCPILILPDLDHYYEYLSAYLPDGDHALSGGVYLNYGYGHFVFTFHDFSQAQAVLAHELAHALVGHLPLPLWLNEGVAQLSEMSVTGRDPCPYEQLRETSDTYWDEETIQDFWSGHGFNRQDEGPLHSYHLAKVLTGWLAKDRKRFIPFLNEARFDDAGDAALRRHYGFSLGELASDYLGDGPWEPKNPPADASDL